MAQNANTDCLFTTVKNVSGSERTFGYLGARGKRLAADETVTIPGNLVSYLGGGGAANGMYQQRRFKALQRSLDDNGSLEIVSTPAVHLYDPLQDRTRQLALVGGQLGVVDPCWYSSGSSDFSAA
jgi:hypothetical protein